MSVQDQPTYWYRVELLHLAFSHQIARGTAILRLIGALDQDTPEVHLHLKRLEKERNGSGMQTRRE